MKPIWGLRQQSIPSDAVITPLISPNSLVCKDSGFCPTAPRPACQSPPEVWEYFEVLTQR